jgi:2-oxoisovalerate dehydrogenase E2 component (dihydrolipoyl transacylase)
MTVFVLPDLGEGLTEAEIVSWQVTEGEHIIADQPLVSVETDKAVVEVPAPYSGTVKALLAKVGDIVATGAPLVEIDTGKDVDKGAIVGELGTGDAKIAKSKIRKPRPDQVGKPSVQSVRASPAIRKLARERGVDLSDISGSGPGGAILSSDIPAAAGPSVAGQELRGVRRAMARAMTRSRNTVVPATITDRADINDWDRVEEPTVRLAQAIAAACKKEPALNAWFDGTRLQRHDHVDLGLAVDTPDGLIVPVLRRIDIAEDIPDQIGKLTQAVRNRTAAPADLQGATITLSNFGMLGGEFASLVVSPPQVAILGAGRISETCSPMQGQPEIRRTLPLSLTFDHRAVAGAEAARFLAAVRADLESPTRPERKKP